MAVVDKVIWTEGMFLKPHHFQQLDRHITAQIIDRPGHAYHWGITHLEIDHTLLAQGKFALKQCCGILPDGTAFSIPDKEANPKPINIPPGTVNQIIYLCLPSRRAGEPEATYAADENHYRYRIETTEICDSNVSSDITAPVEIGRLALSLKLADEDRAAFTCLGIARISAAHVDLSVRLDNSYIPATLNIEATTHFIHILNEIKNLLSARANMLMEQLAATQQGGVAEVADFLLLQLINRYEPLLTHLTESQGFHPAQLFRLLLQLMGELATFNSDNRRPMTPPLYLHHDLYAAFAPIVAELQHALSLVREQNAVAIPITHQQLGTWVAKLPDKTLLQTSYFVLAVHAAMPQENLRNLFAMHTKIAPSEQVRNLVNRSLPGIDIEALPVAPRQIPYHAQRNYFVLNKQHDLFKQLEKSAAIAFHVAGEFPDLSLELWAIKE